MLTADEIAKMTRQERLERLARGPDAYAGLLSGQAQTVLVRRPDAKNWAPTEIVCHLRDTEEFFQGRIETVLAMDDAKFLTVDPDRWAAERQYIRHDAAAAVEAFRARRNETLARLGGLAPEQWQRGGLHPTLGRRTIADFVTGMVGHDDNHLEQLRRALHGEA